MHKYLYLIHNLIHKQVIFLSIFVFVRIDFQQRSHNNLIKIYRIKFSVNKT